MSLISREAAIEACIEVSKQEEEHSKMWATGLRYAKRILAEAPSVPAVPLDKLCEFLEKCGADSYCGTCKQIMGECFTDGKGCGSEHFWKELLTKWMDGLDDTNRHEDA